MFWPSGACVASASITTSSSTITSTACPIAARAEVESRLTARTVEIFLKGERIAAHLRASDNGRHTTVPEHIPSRHRRYAGWTIARIRQDAARIGPATAASCEQILKHRPYLSKASALVSALSAWCDRLAPRVWTLLAPGRSTSARSAVGPCGRSSTTSSIGTTPQTGRR
jgi:hypothetical protein